MHHTATTNLRPARAAFTLIELLIVVAIIAILAAIAVPNFLEAQVRSKVSRVKADVRSLALGMEAYHVDAGAYPIPSAPDGSRIADPIGATTISPFETRTPLGLTTPVAYLTSLPTDVFAVARQGESRLFHCVTLDYVGIRTNHAPVQNWRMVWRNFYRDLLGQNPPSETLYFFQSFGPDQDHDADVPHAAAPTAPHVHGEGELYDPTNGTISSGDILYFGPGPGFVN